MRTRVSRFDHSEKVSTPRTPRAPRAHLQGFSLLNTLVAVMIFAFGMLALAGVYGRLIAVTTQNQNFGQLSAWANSFWGLVQANPATLTALNTASPATYTASTVSTAPTALQPLLQSILVTPKTSLPSGTVTVTTGADAATGVACTQAACSVAVLYQWNQSNSGTASVLRSQSFNYQFGF